MLSHALTTVLLLLCAVALFTTVARRMRLPYPSLLALGGLAMSLFPGLPRLELAPEVVLLVFLPPLLFGAGWRIHYGEFLSEIRPIAVHAIGLVLFTTVGLGFVVHALDPSLPLGAAMVLGAIVSPTDPLAASAVARQVRLPRRIVALLEGESLANDATGLVVYRIAVAAVVTGAFSVAGGAYDFVLLATGGILLGLLVGFISVQLQRVVNDPPIEFAIQLLTGYAAYLPAEHVGFSGVFAAVAAGLVCGRSWSYALGAKSRLQAVAVWDTLDFLLNAVLFLLLGLQLPVVLAEIGDRGLGQLVLTGLGVGLLVVALRMGWMLCWGQLARWRRSGAESAPTNNVAALIGWAGMRGVLSLATALAVPATLADGTPFPGRAIILLYAFCVILLTLVVQGLLLSPVIRLLRIPREEPDYAEDRLARVRTARAARERLATLHADGDELTRELVDGLRAHYLHQIALLEAPVSEHIVGRREVEMARIRGELAMAQREALMDLHARGLIEDHTYRRIERELDLEEDR